MNKIIHQLNEKEYITLVNLLKYEGLISTGGEIKNLIANKEIKYNQKIETRKKKKVYSGDEIIIKNKIIVKIEKI